MKLMESSCPLKGHLEMTFFIDPASSDGTLSWCEVVK